MKDGNVTPTRSANLWYSRRTLLVEASGKLLDDDCQARTMLRSIAAAQERWSGKAARRRAPRWSAWRSSASREAARPWRPRPQSARQAGEIAQIVRHPVAGLRALHEGGPAAVFRRLRAQPEQRGSRAALGVTLPIWARRRASTPKSRPPRWRLFRPVFHALCDARPELLSRENDAAKLPGTYEFPREFRKLRGPTGAVPGGSLPAQPVDRGSVPARLLFFRGAARDHPGNCAARGASPLRPQQSQPAAAGSYGHVPRAVRQAQSAAARRRVTRSPGRSLNGCFSPIFSTTCCWPTRWPWAPAEPALRPTLLRRILLISRRRCA